jgi:hypothetical protein
LCLWSLAQTGYDTGSVEGIVTSVKDGITKRIHVEASKGVLFPSEGLSLISSFLNPETYKFKAPLDFYIGGKRCFPEEYVMIESILNDKWVLGINGSKDTLR